MLEISKQSPHLVEEVQSVLSAQVVEDLRLNLPSSHSVCEVLNIIGDKDDLLPFINLTDKPLTEAQKGSLHFAIASVAAITGSRIFERTVGIALQPKEEFKKDSGNAYFDEMRGENHFGMIRISDEVIQTAEEVGSSPKYADSLSKEAFDKSNAFEQLLIHELGHDVEIAYLSEFYRVEGKTVPKGLNPNKRIHSNLFDTETLEDAKPVTKYAENPNEALAEFMIPYVLEPASAEPIQRALLEEFIINSMHGTPRIGPAHIRITQAYSADKIAN